jgi:hypothetical protein
MLIIAKKKDYYDGVAGTTGIDKTIVYDRQIIEVEENNIPEFFERKRYHFGRNDQSSFHNLFHHGLKKDLHIVYPNYAHFVIGFCGKLYVGWKLYSKGKEHYQGYNDVITTITYDFENAKKLFEPQTWGGRKFADDVNNIMNHDSIELFREFNAPVFVYDGDYGRASINERCSNCNHPKFFINPLLKEYQFYKVFNAVQAFQEIQMFLGGVLGRGEKEIVEVADKYKIAQHGFDKWSFRKEPQNGKV